MDDKICCVMELLALPIVLYILIISLLPVGDLTPSPLPLPLISSPLLYKGDDLPPLKYGHQIREKFREYIDLVPKDLRCILRDDVYEPSRVMGATRSLGSHHSSGGSSSSKGRHAGISTEAVLAKSIAHSVMSAQREIRMDLSSRPGNKSKHCNNSRPGTSGSINRDKTYEGPLNKSAAYQRNGNRTARDDRQD